VPAIGNAKGNLPGLDAVPEDVEREPPDVLAFKSLLYRLSYGGVHR
jgi:hypothetical protein